MKEARCRYRHRAFVCGSLLRDCSFGIVPSDCSFGIAPSGLCLRIVPLGSLLRNRSDRSFRIILSGSFFQDRSFRIVLPGSFFRGCTPKVARAVARTPSNACTRSVQPKEAHDGVVGQATSEDLRVAKGLPLCWIKEISSTTKAPTSSLMPGPSRLCPSRERLGYGHRVVT
jgi:hypothetical protein